MELRQAEPVRVLHHHDGGVRHVDAHLDHHRGHQHIEVRAAEPVHGGFAHFTIHLPVHHAHAQAGEDARRQRARRAFGILQPGGALLHCGHHHVALLAAVDARAHERVDVRFLVAAHHARGDRLPSRGPRADHRDVEVAEDGERQRARDRRGGHHQDVRHLAGGGRHLAAHGGALLDAEAVLFVDHGEREIAEHRAIEKERVRSHRDLAFARGEPRKCRAPRRGSEAAGQQFHAHVASRQESPDRHAVLLGEEFGGRHDRRLPAGCHRGQHPVERHRRLAAAHVTLEQAVHGDRASQVRGNLAARPGLLVGEGKRKARPDACVDRLGHGDGRRACALAHLPLLHHDAKLQEKQFLEREPPPRLALLVDAGGRVHPSIALRERGQGTRCPVLRGKRVFHGGRQGRQHRRHRALDLARQEFLACGIDRPQALAPRRGFHRAFRLPLGVCQLQVLAAQLGLALDDAARPGVELLTHPRRVEPDGAHGAGVVLEGGLGPGLRSRDVPHRRHLHPQRGHRRFAALAEVGEVRHGALAPVVLIPHREVPKQVARGGDPQVPERRTRARPDAGQRLDRRRWTKFRVLHDAPCAGVS